MTCAHHRFFAAAQKRRKGLPDFIDKQTTALGDNLAIFGEIMLREFEKLALQIPYRYRNGQVKIDTFKRFGDMKLPRSAVETDAIPVVEPVCRTRTLLNFIEFHAVADCMNKTAGNEKRIILLRIVLDENIFKSAIRDGALNLCHADTGLEAGINGPRLQNAA